MRWITFLVVMPVGLSDGRLDRFATLAEELELPPVKAIQFTANRLRLRAQGCRFGLPWVIRLDWDSTPTRLRRLAQPVPGWD